MAEEAGIERGKLLALTSEIVTAYVGKNRLEASEVTSVIQLIFDTISGLAWSEVQVSVELTPAVPIKRSVTDDHIFCLEDGLKFKVLKRHLMTDHGMTPEEYRAKWGLKADYPMVAPNYSAKRQDLAKEMGLGRRPSVLAPEPGPKPRGRRKTAA